MESVEQFQSIKVGHGTLLSVLRCVTLAFTRHTMFHKARMRIGEVVRKIAQNYEEHISGES